MQRVCRALLRARVRCRDRRRDEGRARGAMKDADTLRASRVAYRDSQARLTLGESVIENLQPRQYCLEDNAGAFSKSKQQPIVHPRVVGAY